MTCPQRDRAEAFLDGDLNERQTIAYEQHVKQCEECATEVASLQEYLSEMRSLSEVTAPDNAWAQILLSIEAEAQSETHADTHNSAQHDVAAKQQSLLQRLQELLFSPQAAMLTACAVCAVFVLFGRMERQPTSRHTSKQPQPTATQQRQHMARQRIQQSRPAPTHPAPRAQRLATGRRAAPPARRKSKAKGIDAVMAALRGARRQYEQALAQLSVAAMARLKQEPAKARVLHKTLLALDQAIAQCKEALRQEPTSLDTQRVLLAVYQRKVDLLRDVVLGNI